MWSFGRASPGVEKVEVLGRDVGADGSKAELAIWLRSGAVDEPFGAPVTPSPPAREADLSRGADGLCEASWFWDRLKGVEHTWLRLVATICWTSALRSPSRPPHAIPVSPWPSHINYSRETDLSAAVLIFLLTNAALTAPYVFWPKRTVAGVS